MTRRDPEQIAALGMSVALVAIVLGLFFLVALIAVDGIHGKRAMERCGDRGGKVEHYDATRPELWRCLGARWEAE